MLDYYKPTLIDYHKEDRSCIIQGKGILTGLRKLDAKYECNYIGRLDLLANSSVAIIGSRESDKDDWKRVNKVIAIIKSYYDNDKHKFNIVSGLAKGIDTAAHTLALDNNLNTIACIPTSIDSCYPTENQYLKEYIEDHGLVLSCFPEGSKLVKNNFIVRNYLIALLSSVVVLVRADEESGTRHVFREAIELNRYLVILKSLYDKHISWIDQIAKKSVRLAILEKPEDLIKVLNTVLNLEYKNNVK